MGIGGNWDRFYMLPIPVVLAALWLLGVALLGCGVLTLYVLATSLVAVEGGA